jgi:hypothetical protein
VPERTNQNRQSITISSGFSTKHQTPRQQTRIDEKANTTNAMMVDAVGYDTSGSSSMVIPFWDN